MYFAHRRGVLDASQRRSTRAQLHSDLVNLTHPLWYPRSIRILLKDYLSSKVANRLILDVSFLGRLKSAYHVIIKCAHGLSNFRHISIKPSERVSRPPLLSEVDSAKMDLAETLRSARLPMTDSTVKQHINNDLSVAQANEAAKKQAYNSRQGSNDPPAS